MTHTENWLYLQLFGEGGEGGASAAGEGQTGEPASDAAKQDGRNPLENVVYGKQAEAQNPAVQEPKEDAKDRSAQYKQFKKDFKDLYDADVQSIVQGRLRNAKETQERLDSVQPLLGMLKNRYGLETDNVDAIINALEDDESFIEAEAMKHGMDTQTYRQMSKLQRENTMLSEKMSQIQQQKETDRIFQNMLAESEQLKTIYPAFDLETELQNERFVNLIKAPTIDLRTAYEVVHKDEIMPAVMQVAAQKTEDRVLSAVRANRERPVEGTSAKNSAVTVKSDPSTWTNADLNEVSRRVQRGEKIKL